MAKDKTAHVIQYLGTQEMICTHCGGRFEINSVLPNRIWVVSCLMRGFIKEHRRCKLDDGGRKIQAWMEEHWETLPKPTPVD